MQLPTIRKYFIADNSEIRAGTAAARLVSLRCSGFGLAAKVAVLLQTINLIGASGCLAGEQLISKGAPGKDVVSWPSAT